MAKKTTASTYIPIGAAVGAGLLLYWYATRAQAQPTLPPVVEPPRKPKRPPGHPPPYGSLCRPSAYGGKSRYDTSYWEVGSEDEIRERIFEAFESLGYETPEDRDTMNDPGAPGDGLGAAGEVPDLPSEEVRRFQKDYNRASRAKFLADMGGLDEDGFVGPCTLNAIVYVRENLFDKKWPVA